ncbi:MAG: EAL domain-containing protein [Halieaceae bacterium]|nr:EAL domain-containing protein [Halieaceae bacterium]
MSLFKQLWLAIVILLTLVFGGSFIVSSLSAKAYLEQQLSMKNADNANALALSLTQQGADLILLELTLAAQFDTGFYELIQLEAPDGTVPIFREDTQPITDAPNWFVSLFPIQVEPGIASVAQGWQQVGVITLRSHSKFAYRQLWEGTIKMALVFFVAMLAAGALGSYVLSRILRPLDDVVDQAEAIGNRRFITIPEPYTKEFKQVVSAMNRLSGRIKAMLEQEARRLEKWQRDAHVDKVTQLMNREPFMKALEASLESDDVNSTGSLSLIRFSGLANLNQTYGRRAIDKVLHEIGKALNTIASGHSRWVACRLNGSDFALLAPRAPDTAAAREIQNAIAQVLENQDMHDAGSLPGASTIYEHGETIGEIMTRLDRSLLASAEGGESQIIDVQKGDVQLRSLKEQLDEWREILDRSFDEHRFTLTTYPVIDLDGNLIHMETPVRLQHEGEILSAGRFLPWINRLEMSYLLDKEVVSLALQHVKEHDQPVGVNLSVAAVFEPDFVGWLDKTLSINSTLADKLWLEVPESMAFRHMEKFRSVVECARSHRSKVGIEHVGHHLAELGRISDLGLDYLKIDASFLRDVDQNTANQTLLTTLCTVGHSIGLKVFAEGVRTERELAFMRQLGVDGVAGPAVSVGKVAPDASDLDD